MSLLSRVQTHFTPHERVRSSNVQSLTYDGVNKVMQVKFRNGGTYNYYGVPLEDYNYVLGAESIGRALNRAIKGTYGYERITPKKPTGRK